MSKGNRHYTNGILVNSGNNSTVFIANLTTKGHDGDRELVEVFFHRFWSKALTKKQKKQFHFTRDFFGRTYTMFSMKMGKDIFEQMCYAIAYKNMDSTTFTWNEKNQNQ